MVYGTFAIRIAILTSHLSLGIQSQNLQDYWDSYLIMLLGGILIMGGLFLAVQFRKGEKQQQNDAMFSDLNQQISEIRNNATSPAGYSESGVKQVRDLLLDDINVTGSKYLDNNASTEFLPQETDEIEMLAGVLPGETEIILDMNETAAMDDEG